MYTYNLQSKSFLILQKCVPFLPQSSQEREKHRGILNLASFISHVSFQICFFSLGFWKSEKNTGLAAGLTTLHISYVSWAGLLLGAPFPLSLKPGAGLSHWFPHWAVHTWKWQWGLWSDCKGSRNPYVGQVWRLNKIKPHIHLLYMCMRMPL